MPRAYHLPGQHDQLDHGNWADGEKSNVSKLPEKVRERFLEFESHIANLKGYESAAIAWSKEKPETKVAAATQVTYHIGEKDRVEFDLDTIDALMADGNAILTHNHPADISADDATILGLSVADIRLAFRTNLKEIRAVVNHESGYYVFSFSRGKEWPPVTILQHFFEGAKWPHLKATENIEKYEKLFYVSRERGLRTDGAARRSINLGLSHARVKLLADFLNANGGDVTYRMVKVSDKNVRA